jgi:hypothetical protein
MTRGLLVAIMMLSVTSALAQTPRDAPRDGYGFHDERTVGPFIVQRWVNTASPGVSAAGVCDCFTVVYDGDRRVATFGTAGTLAAYTITDSSGSDLNADGYPDLVVSAWSGGAHCCYSSGIYSVGETVQQVLSLETGNCGPGELEDLDGNGTFEFITCDDRWAYSYCSFADSPLPRVVYVYESSRGVFVPATPRFASHYRNQLAAALEEAQTWLSESGGRDSGIDKCRLLRPALGLMYSGRFDDGLVLIRSLYHGADREQFERETAEKVRTSPMWAGK